MPSTDIFHLSKPRRIPLVRQSTESIVTPPITKFTCVQNIRRIGIQLWYISLMAFGDIGVGTIVGYTSQALPSIREKNPFEITATELDVFAALFSVGSFVGALISGPLTAHWGRLRPLQASTVLMTSGWLLIGLSKSVSCLLTGRFLLGALNGLITPIIVGYLGECVSPTARKSISMIPGLFHQIGILTIYAAGAVLDWSQCALLCVALAVVWAAMLFFVPESPIWLLQKSQRQADIKESHATIEKAKNTVARLRGISGDKLDRDFIEIWDNVMKPSVQPVKESPRGSFFPSLKDPGIRRPLFIVVTLFITSHWSGIYTNIMFTDTFLTSSDNLFKPSYATVVIGCIALGANIAISLALAKYGRRTLLKSSTICIIPSYAALGLYFFLEDYYRLPLKDKGFSPVPLLLVFFIVLVSNAFATVPYILLGELFPERARYVCQGFVMGISYLSMTTFLLCFSRLLALITRAGLCWLHMASTFLALGCVIYLLPETKGRSLEEIEAHFSTLSPPTPSPAPRLPVSASLATLSAAALPSTVSTAILVKEDAMSLQIEL